MTKSGKEWPSGHGDEIVPNAEKEPKTSKCRHGLPMANCLSSGSPRLPLATPPCEMKIDFFFSDGPLVAGEH